MKTRLGNTDLLPDRRFDHGLNFDLAPSTGHETTWDLISRWFLICTSSHKDCNAPGKTVSFKPRRVLKFDRTGEAVSFQLVDGTECAAESAYMTLSYCWGSQPASQAYRLLKTTEQDMRSKQPITHLPKTIRDTMEIAMYFKCNQLWVDRLCIFQDSAEDFQREASSMADIYKYSTLNIAALGAQDADGGCFFERDPRYVAPTRVDIQHNRHNRYERPMPYRFESERRLGLRSTFETEPLIHRAWTVQERILARRVIYFGSKQVFWECKHAHLCETHPAEARVSDDVGKIIVTKDERWGHLWERLLQEGDDNPWRLLLTKLVRLSDPCEQLLADWSGIVTLFSKCALTVPSDKLVALSGVANELKRRLEELRPGARHRYVAGLWEEELPGVLVWRVSEPASRAASYRAPTWSWASIDGLVRFPLKFGGTNSVFSALTAVEVAQPPGEAETGQVESASITLLGPVLRAKVSLTLGWHNPGSVEFTVASLCEASDTGSTPCQDSDAMAPVQLGITHSRVVFDTLDDIRQDIFQMIIQTDGVKVEGIAIVVADMDPCTYRRVGYIQYQFGDPDVDLSEGSREARHFAERISKRSVVIV